MKASQNTLESLADIHRVESSGQIRRIGAQMLLALARKELPAADIDAAAGMLMAQAAHLMAEVKVAIATVELRKQSVQLGHIPEIGQRIIVDSSGRILE